MTATALRITEDQLQKSVVQYLTMVFPPNGDVLFFHVPNGGRRDIREASKFKAMGVRPGVADLIFLSPGATHFIELKTDSGRQTPAQKDFARLVDRLGLDYQICRSIDEVSATIKTWGLLTPREATRPSRFGKITSQQPSVLHAKTRPHH